DAHRLRKPELHQSPERGTPRHEAKAPTYSPLTLPSVFTPVSSFTYLVESPLTGTHNTHFPFEPVHVVLVLFPDGTFYLDAALPRLTGKYIPKTTVTPTRNVRLPLLLDAVRAYH
ncbi:MAG: hypothetical protein ACTSYX_09455, partial [Candidatus Thorarchaeota archaeon]